MECTLTSALKSIPGLCWIQHVAKVGYSFQSDWLGIPDWMGYFSSSELPAMQLTESMYLHILGFLAMLLIIGTIYDARYEQQMEADMSVVDEKKEVFGQEENGTLVERRTPNTGFWALMRSFVAFVMLIYLEFVAMRLFINLGRDLDIEIWLG